MNKQLKTWSNEAVPLREITEILTHANAHRPLVVCDEFLLSSEFFKTLIAKLDFKITSFHEYEPNPTFTAVIKGIQVFKENHCDFIISIGGGSSIDVGKSIKAVLNAPTAELYFEEKINPSNIPQLAIPTTAGTGSESTHFAVVYYQNKKQSISHEQLLPNYVLFTPALLVSLPLYQRKAGMLDALCQAIESYWSLQANAASRTCSRQAITIILNNYPAFLQNTSAGNCQLMKAANLAGQAINITTTTAAHAMSYKLTSMYQIAHGHAVGICLPHVWQYMLNHLELTQPSLTPTAVSESFQELAELLECNTPQEAITTLINLMHSIQIEPPTLHNNNELKILAHSVNIQRLNNNPLRLGYSELLEIYKSILLNKITVS
ncbi:phosphonoacetaldehyde reductase [Liquorilactobacillus satsumensis]|uniref:phosphonoacetaldehyde reductase n=1 Tax=Liquorilactobacillus satsumensis TaxID=259059 RepID=UPI001E39A1AF|nr:phosphonoacetaldehyde reductase [Liquorilactobacillus satsumensis]MCC7667748.1 alcohol dehydrogenase [Liquorilactobacillus satsumensis]MCP9356921.1 phosphonoacetaldehyde reductase [Liquorilactobacillus satsumensis]MCP9370868.1 phosphonoacetaldehyde reductase [Liquorilactobacillus satsumensis]